MNKTLPMGLIKALISFKQAYLELNRQWDAAGDDCFNDMDVSHLYPFHIFFDKLAVSKWVDTIVSRATDVFPDEIPNHRCIDDPSYTYNIDTLMMQRSTPAPPGIYAEEPMVPFHRPSVLQFLFSKKNLIEGDIPLMRLTDMQLYLLYIQVLEIIERGKEHENSRTTERL